MAGPTNTETPEAPRVLYQPSMFAGIEWVSRDEAAMLIRRWRAKGVVFKPDDRGYGISQWRGVAGHFDVVRFRWDRAKGSIHEQL